jgi:hypothetical protein
MGRQWSRHDASLEDIRMARKRMLEKNPGGEIFFDEYLVDTHKNDYGCNANKFYYGAVVEKDNRFYALTAWGRIGDYDRAFGKMRAFDEGSSINFDSAKAKLNVKLNKKKRGKTCRKCKTRQGYSPFAPKHAENFKAESEGLYSKGEMEEFAKMKKERGNSTDPKQCSNCGGTTRWPVGEYVVCITCMKPLYSLSGKEYADAQPHWTGRKSWRNQFNADELSPEIFGKLVGQYPQPPNNPSPVGGFMDNGFEWTVNQAETFNADLDLSNCTFCKKYAGNPFYMVDGRYAWEKVPACVSCKDKLPDEAWKKLNPVKYGAETGLEAITEPEVFGASSIVSKVKHNWLNTLIGLGVALVGYDYLKKKTFNSDTLIEGPNTGDLTPADYEEIVVESTGYVVPIIPIGLDGSFMGSRFHALATDRYVYDSPEGIGAHIDIAINTNTDYLPNEMSLVQASEAPGQSPYNSILPNGQENKDFPLRVIHETTTVSLDAGVASYIPTDLSGYTGQQFVPTSVYENMLGIGISGQTPIFKTPITQELGANHLGSRIANPDMLTNVGGPLKESVNGDYTDGNKTMSLSQWSVENQVQQTSDTEAIVIERGSGLRKMIRRV